MEITIKITESENGKPSITVKEEGNNPKSNSKKSNELIEKTTKKGNSKEEKSKNSKIRSLKELVKRRKWLLKMRDNLKKEIEASDNKAELRKELEMLEQTLIEYQWLFGEIE